MRDSDLSNSTGTSRRLEINNRNEEIPRMSKWLNALTAELQLPERVQFHLDLCANEAVTNIIHYAYVDELPHTIVLRLDRNDEQITLTIEDDGEPFNPLSLPDSPAPEDLASAKIGGLGIKLIRNFMPGSQYTRRRNRNVLTLSSPLSKA